MRSLIVMLFFASFSCYAQTTVKKTPVTRGTITVRKPAAEGIYVKVDVPAGFPGGRNEMLAFIWSNMNYPQSVKKGNIIGTCYTTFVVEKNGSITNIQVIKGVKDCPECDQEALRIIKLMPRWLPAMKDSAAVRMQLDLPIRFQLKY